ncbi:MAG: methionyl-tRNA formyltransferase, partial [Armatimonadetes bacterium]|nr:methionyl-tRNA formyltransferase [Armatimonadota bacterium]
MNAVFMGTPTLAVPCLDAVHAWAGGAVRVVTQPDRPRGRSGEPQPSAVKARAAELGLEVYQPERLRGNAEALA